MCYTVIFLERLPRVLLRWDRAFFDMKVVENIEVAEVQNFGTSETKSWSRSHQDSRFQTYFNKFKLDRALHVETESRAKLQISSCWIFRIIHFWTVSCFSGTDLYVFNQEKRCTWAFVYMFSPNTLARLSHRRVQTSSTVFCECQQLGAQTAVNPSATVLIAFAGRIVRRKQKRCTYSECWRACHTSFWKSRQSSEAFNFPVQLDDAIRFPRFLLNTFHHFPMPRSTSHRMVRFQFSRQVFFLTFFWHNFKTWFPCLFLLTMMILMIFFMHVLNFA